jgi:hypothetical protein
MLSRIESNQRQWVSRRWADKDFPTPTHGLGTTERTTMYDHPRAMVSQAVPDCLQDLRAGDRFASCHPAIFASVRLARNDKKFLVELGGIMNLR